MAERDPPIRCAVAGAGGRMGERVLALAAADRGVAVVAAWVGPGSSRLGQPVAGLAGLAYSIVGAAAVPPQVVVDFSGPAGFDPVLAWCRAQGAALVCGSTGLAPEQHRALADAAGSIPVLWSANFALGVAVLARAVAAAARALPDWQVEIVEAHHAGKRDAPSGTALALGEAVAGARGQSLAQQAVFARHGDDGRRDPAAIGFAVLRAGDIVGEHTVILAGPGERLEFGHRAGDRGIFARGALRAAHWLAGRAPGAYRFEDTLG
jgi:4-hydroxy-tetrahydrodipicolinate reductase